MTAPPLPTKFYERECLRGHCRQKPSGCREQDGIAGVLIFSTMRGGSKRHHMLDVDSFEKISADKTNIGVTAFLSMNMEVCAATF